MSAAKGQKAFAVAVLRGIGANPTSENLRAMIAWENAEGGHTNGARYNWLNTTQPMKGAGNTGTQGNIKVYRSFDQGVKATVKTLMNGRYTPVIKALRNGRSAQDLAQALGQTPWGTSADLVSRVVASTPEIHVGKDVIDGVLNASDRRPGYVQTITGKPQTRRDTTTTIQPGGQDIDSALTDILMQGSGKVESIHNRASLATKLVAALDSGLYDRPDVVTKHTTESFVPGAAPSDLESGPSASVARATRRANRLDAKQLNYLYGGGHDKKRIKIKSTGPLDCSSAVSAVLGVDVRVSGEFEKFGKPGRSKDGINIYANPDHVLMEIGGKFFGTSRTNPGGGAGWIPRSAVPESYLKNFTVRHV